MKLISKCICDGGVFWVVCLLVGFLLFFFLILCLQVEKSIRVISESENCCSTDGVSKEVCASAGFFGGIGRMVVGSENF